RCAQAFPDRRSSGLLRDLDEVAHLVQHPADLGRVRHLDRVPDPPQSERAQRVQLPLVGTVARLALRHLDPAHDWLPSVSAPGAASVDSAVSAESATAAEATCAPSTEL